MGVASFVASIILVPLINKISSYFTKDRKGILTSDNKNRFRNNYARSGLTLGAGIGAVLGLLIGNWCFGLIMAATIFSALGAVIGAVALSVYGYRIHRKLHGPLAGCDLSLRSATPSEKTLEGARVKNRPILIHEEGQYSIYGCLEGRWERRQFVLSVAERSELNAFFQNKIKNRKVSNLDPLLTTSLRDILKRGHTALTPGKTDNDEDIENSWDYVTRCTASVFGFIGAAVVCAINPALALLLVPIGTAIASALGWVLGLLIMKRARSLPGNKNEKPASTLPWTQRITTGANLGSIIGGCIGLAVGFSGFILGGPAGVIFAVSLFGAIGAVVGGICGALYDEEARCLIWQALNPWSGSSKLPHQPSRKDLSLSPSLGVTAKVLQRIEVKLEDAPLNRSPERLQPSSHSTSPSSQSRIESSRLSVGSNGLVLFSSGVGQPREPIEHDLLPSSPRIAVGASAASSPSLGVTAKVLQRIEVKLEDAPLNRSPERLQPSSHSTSPSSQSRIESSRSSVGSNGLVLFSSGVGQPRGPIEHDLLPSSPRIAVGASAASNG